MYGVGGGFMSGFISKTPNTTTKPPNARPRPCSRDPQPKMPDLVLSEDATKKAKQEEYFAFLISDVAIPEGTPRVDVVAALADAGISTEEDDVVFGPNTTDSRNERMLIKAVGCITSSGHRWNEGALSQLAATWPSSRMTKIELGNYGAYSFKTGSQLMANASILPFGGASHDVVAYVAGASMLSNMYTAERMEMMTKSLL